MLSLSAKSERILKELGVAEGFERGDTLVLTGPTYELRKDPGVCARLAFLYDDEHRLCIGYARDDDGEWRVVEYEPFSLRALGYYQRHLKRKGDVVARDREMKR
jgi:hypothetical protein